MINVTPTCVQVKIKYYKDETKFKEINICGVIVKNTHLYDSSNVCLPNFATVSDLFVFCLINLPCNIVCTEYAFEI